MCWPRPDTFAPIAIALRQRRTSKLRAAPFSFESSCERAPAGGTELEDVLSRSDLEEENEEQSPDSTRPEHPVVTDACVQALGCLSLPHPPKAHLARLSREGQTYCAHLKFENRPRRLPPRNL